jgi:hypothetical protein
VVGPDHPHTLAVVNDLNKVRVVVEGNENEGQSADSSLPLVVGMAYR